MKEVGELSEITTKTTNRTMKKRELTLVDDTGFGCERGNVYVVWRHCRMEHPDDPKASVERKSFPAWVSAVYGYAEC